MALPSFNKARYFNRTLFFSVLLVAISTFNYGFDNQAFATTQAMDHFQRSFGEYNEATEKYALDSDWLALFNSLNYIGFVVGVIVGSIISARFGRRWCMFTMSIYALGTATITVTSNSREQIMAARILNYIYVGMELSVIPIFQSEIVPAPVRGLVVGTYQMSLGFGGLVINSICYGTSQIDDNRQWRIPLGLFYIVPSIIAVSIFFVPESPRWLLRNSKPEAAKTSLRKFRDGAFTEEEIEKEYQELVFALDNETEQGRFVELFRGRNLTRTLIAAGVNFFQQATGQAFSSQYGAVYVRSLGVFNPMIYSVMSSGIGLFIMIGTVFAVDKVGRRKLLLLSSSIMLCGLITMAGLGIFQPVNEQRTKGIVAMLIIFGVGFATGWGPLTYVVSAEVTSLRLRDLTTRLGFTVNVCFNFAVNFSVPYLVFPDHVGLDSKVGFIFGGVVLLSFAFVYFCVPECKGKTLEQIDWLFSNGVALRDFGRADASMMLDEGAVAENPLGRRESDIEISAAKTPSKTEVDVK